jgi:hypoxanthine-DNA glycosylase
MATLERNRTIRTATRASESSPYKIDTKKVTIHDTLVVNIDHESKDFFETYTFSGNKVADKNSISFKAIHHGSRIDITWSGAQPDGLPNRDKPVRKVGKLGFPAPPKRQRGGLFAHLKGNNVTEEPTDDFKVVGFDPVINKKSKILILGTMPGAESLKKQEYYAFSRNIFWKIIGEILNKNVPGDYKIRKKLLLDHKIAFWDVCKSCYRPGSLDADIKDAVPNDLEKLITDYPEIKTIAFNGQEAAKLFGKHFGSLSGIKLLSLPSTSPANAAIPYEDKLTKWSGIKQHI